MYIFSVLLWCMVICKWSFWRMLIMYRSTKVELYISHRNQWDNKRLLKQSNITYKKYIKAGNKIHFKNELHCSGQFSVLAQDGNQVCAYVCSFIKNKNLFFQSFLTPFNSNQVSSSRTEWDGCWRGNKRQKETFLYFEDFGC